MYNINVRPIIGQLAQQKVLRGTMPSVPSHHGNMPVSSAVMQMAPSDPSRNVDGVSYVDDTFEMEHDLPQFSMLDNMCDMLEAAHAAVSV